MWAKSASKHHQNANDFGHYFRDLAGTRNQDITLFDLVKPHVKGTLIPPLINAEAADKRAEAPRREHRQQQPNQQEDRDRPC